MSKENEGVPKKPRTVLGEIAEKARFKQGEVKLAKNLHLPEASQKEHELKILAGLLHAMAAGFRELGFNDLPLPGEEQIVFAPTVSAPAPVDEVGEKIHPSKLLEAELREQNRGLRMLLGKERRERTREHQLVESFMTTILTTFPVDRVAEVFGMSLKEINDLPFAEKLQVVSQVKHLLRSNSSESPERKPVKEIGLWEKSDKEWMQVTLPHDKGDQLRRGLIYLIAASGLSTRDFAKISGFRDTATVSTLKSGQKMPRLSTIKKVIEASPLPNESRTAQYLYLLWNKGSLRSIEELADASAGDVVSYIKMLKGESREDVAQAFNKTETSISDWIRNKSQPYIDKQDVINWVGSSNPALIEILLHKISKSPRRIPEEVIERVLSEEYLFAEHLDSLGTFAMSAEEESLLEETKAFKTRLQDQGEHKLYGQLLRSIRVKKDLPLKVLGPTAESNESGRFLPTDLSVMHQARALGYNLPDPLACLLLDVVTDERGTKNE